MSEHLDPAARTTDPVSVFADGRVAWYPSGRPGVGGRRWKRHRGNRAAGEAFAARKRAELAGLAEDIGQSLDDDPSQAPFSHLMSRLVEHLKETGAPKGTVNQYRSNWNCWVPERVRTTPCAELRLPDWTRVFDEMGRAHASPGTIAAVKRTLGKALSFGVPRGYFGEDEPFHCSSIARAAVVRAEKQRAAHRHAEELAAAEAALLAEETAAPGASDRAGDAGQLSMRAARLAAAVVEAELLKRYTPQVCPTVADVERFADAFEEQYPGYGSRLVLLAYATGLRINELLALRVGDIDLTTGEVQVRRQLDRDQAWPATKRPKGHKTRTASLWSHYAWVAEELIADATRPGRADPGWLFPRPRPVKHFARQVGGFATAAAVAADWPWRFHWLRHAYAATSLAPVDFGGYGLPLASVSAWLGHESESTTQDMYDARQADDTQTARRVTARRPGTTWCANGTLAKVPEASAVVERPL